MKMKSSNPLQQHVEKVVLAVGVVFLVVVAGFLTVGNPYSVDANGRSVSPSKAEAELIRLSELLEQRLRAEEGLEPTIRGREIPPYLSDIERRLSQPVIDLEQYPIALHLPGIEDFGPAADPDPYHVPPPNLPGELTAYAGYGMLGDAADPDVHERLWEFVHNEQTRDFRYVTVGGTFDAPEWADRLRAQPPAGQQLLPEGWWMHHWGIAGMYLQRERLDTATGEWTDRRIVDALPTQIAFRSEEERLWSRQEAEQTITRIRTQWEEIARPPFVPTTGTVQWVPPHDAGRSLSTEDQREVADINRKIRDARQVIEREEARLERMGGTSPRVGQEQQDQRAPLPWDLDADRDADRPRTQPATREQRVVELIEGKLVEIRDLEISRDRLYGIEREDDLRDRAADRGQRDEDFDRRDRRDRRGGEAAMPVDDIRVWAHDLDVQPGETYRYRLVASVLNPLFQRTALAADQQERYYNRLTLWPSNDELEAAPWSEPVRLDPEYHFFLVDGTPSREEAKVEVWRLYRGEWRREVFDVRPGDRIGGVAEIDEEANVAMRVNAALVDLVAVEGGSRGVRMIYIDRADGGVGERVAEQDREHDDRVRLRNELDRVVESQSTLDEAAARRW